MVLVFSLTYGQEDTTNVIELGGLEVIGVRSGNKMPITETTITDSDIKRGYQGEEVPSILDKTPAITSHSDGGHPQGYTYFRLRGMDQTRINMTLNGTPLNEPEDQGGYFSNFPGFSNNIKSAQIQRGVGTSTNGVSSYAGSINFESPTGKDKGSEIELGYGSYNTMRFNASNSTGLSDKGFALYTNFATQQTDGYKDHSGNKGYSFFLSGGFYGKKDIIKVTAFTGQSFNEMAWLAVSKDDIRDNPKTNYNHESERDDFMQSFAQVQHTRRLGSNSTISTTLYYNKLDGGWTDKYPESDTVTNFRLSSNFGGIISNYKYVKDGLNLNVGIHGNLYERSHKKTYVPFSDDVLFTNKGVKNEASGFIKGTYTINKLSLFADAQLRHTMFKYVGDLGILTMDWTFFNPKGGLVYKHNKNYRTYVSIGQTFREPTRTDLFLGESNATRNEDNNQEGYKDFKREEVVDLEIGSEYSSDKFTTKINLYYMKFKNEIVPIGKIGSNSLPLMESVNSSFRSGVEIEVMYKPYEELVITNNTSLSYNRMEYGEQTIQPLYTPPLVSNTNIYYLYNGWYIGANLKIHSSSYIGFSGDNKIDPFGIVGMGMGYTYRGYSISAKINNITSERYYTNGYIDGEIPYYYVNAPTSLYITLKIIL